MASICKVINTVVVRSRTVPVPTTAAEMATSHAQPKVRFKVALGAFRDVPCDDLVGIALVEEKHVLARLDIELPLRDGALIIR
jgi:hypothetical protein